MSNSIVDDEVQAQLVSLCTKDGSVEQAKNAVVTLASLFDNDQNKRDDVFKPILEILTSSHRLTLVSGNTPNTKIVNVLDTLTTIVERVPSLFTYSPGRKGYGNKVVRFALDSVLLGRGTRCSVESQFDSEKVDENETSQGVGGRRTELKAKRNRRSTNGDKSISLACQRVQGAINFLVTHIRSTIMPSSANLGKENPQPNREKFSAPPDDHISVIFDLLTGILIEDGAPPSITDHDDCKEDDEKAALRKCATINIMRLCDSQIGLEKKFFTHSMWHTLGKSFLDRNESVRGKY